MHRRARSAIAIAAAAGLLLFAQSTRKLRLLVYDPGHFHATLLQKEMLPDLDSKVSVYAPLGPELVDYLNRVSLFNNRLERPTRWELEIHTGPKTFDRMLQDRAGDVVVFSGHNRGKIDRILASLDAGLHVLADKPWITSAADLPKLERALEMADHKHLVAYDIMTERFEVTSQVTRELVSSRDIFGTLVSGDAANPAINARSIHHIRKTVAGVALQRPVWFFDTSDYGDALQDVGTHVVDLIHWTAFPGDASLDSLKDIVMGPAPVRHDSVVISPAQFREVTGVAKFPAELQSLVGSDGSLRYPCNAVAEWRVRGSQVRSEVLWKWEAAAGGDVYEVAFRGSKATVEVRQGVPEVFVPEVYVSGGNDPQLETSVQAAISRLQSRWPGIAARRVKPGEFRIAIPPQFRVGHEDHFGAVAGLFLGYVRKAGTLPAWERAQMLAKYRVTTAQ